MKMITNLNFKTITSGITLPEESWLIYRDECEDTDFDAAKSTFVEYCYPDVTMLVIKNDINFCLKSFLNDHKEKIKEEMDGYEYANTLVAHYKLNDYQIIYIASDDSFDFEIATFLENYFVENNIEIVKDFTVSHFNLCKEHFELETDFFQVYFDNDEFNINLMRELFDYK